MYDICALCCAVSQKKKKKSTSCNYFLKQVVWFFLKQGHQDVNLSTESRWGACCQSNCSWLYDGVLIDCRAYLPVAGRADTPNLIFTCAAMFMGHYVIWRYWLSPKSISVPCNAVRTKMCPCNWVRNMSYSRPDHGQVLLTLKSFYGIFNTDVLISACFFLIFFLVALASMCTSGVIIY